MALTAAGAQQGGGDDMARAGKTNGAGVDAGVLIPIDVKGANPMIGGLLSCEVDRTPSLGFTGRIGFFYGVSDKVGGFDIQAQYSMLSVTAPSATSVGITVGYSFAE